MALQEQTRNGPNPTKSRIKLETEIDDARRPLPMWCRGIMSGCVNCGGCV